MELKIVIIIAFTISSLGLRGVNPAKQVQKAKELKIEIVNQEVDNKVDVTVDGKPFTSYCWFDKVYKPVLYPVYTSAGTVITRGFPLIPREGERDDHIHQVGIWLNYGNVNGIDFWGNGASGSKNPEGGVIKHLSVEKISSGIGMGVLITKAGWIAPSGKELLAEKTEFHFIAYGSVRIIDRITTLTATGDAVLFKDTKEGMFGIRVARQLELPSSEAVILTDAKGNPARVKVVSNEGVTGNYKSSEGVGGEAVWGTRARWMELYGKIGDEKISLVVCDHPKNQSYPTWWHARGYGLFSANPLGVSDFTKGTRVLNFTIAQGDTATFRYRVIINSGTHLTDSEINALANDFAKIY
jgi:hypothetical protein